MLFRAAILAALAAAVYGQASAPADGCLVCGDGQIVTKPDAIFSFTGYPATKCDVLQIAGLTGQIPLDQCPFLPGLITPDCECAPGDLPGVVAPTPAPVASNKCPPVPASGCSVCGTDLCISNPDALFSFPGQSSAPCGILETAGLTGLITPEECPFLPNLVDVCECGTTGVPPTAAPTKAPSEAPVTPAPTETPVEPPTPAPVAPVAPPTPAPATPVEPTISTAPTTKAPVDLAPVVVPTKAPTEAPVTPVPTPSPTKAPVPAPTPFPVFMFTPAPFVSVPTTVDGKKGKMMSGGGGGGGGMGMGGKKRALREEGIDAAVGGVRRGD